MGKSKNREPLELPPSSLTADDHSLLTKKPSDDERKRKEESVLREAFQGTRVVATIQKAEIPPLSTESPHQYREILLSQIQAGKYQPRQVMDPEAHEDLVRSIQSNGLLNPILVRGIGGNLFEIIAGERRWLACKELQFERIPALIQDRDDRSAAVQSLLDNIVRDNLSPYDQAVGIKRLMTEFRLKQIDVADQLGLSKGRISQTLGILELPEPILQLMFQSKTGMTDSHARALLPLKDNVIRMERLAKDAIAKGWSRDKLKAEVEKLPRTNAGAQAVRLQYRGHEGINGFELHIRYHPNRPHEKDLVKNALQEALEYLDKNLAPLPSSPNQ